ncbi:MAG TPA: hypothetical protein VD788_09005 [Candidatus Polarisedimenticolaceae bacterium]|nr:hypothetical protein [Candidatus Polarisedimenticolaceae bacterium]
MVVVLLALPASAANINGFLRDEGEFDVAISYNAESYDEFWAGNEITSAPPLGEVSTNTASLWLAYGVTESISVWANIPYVDVEGDGSGNLSDSGLQDLIAMGEFRLAGKPHGEGWGVLIGGIGFSTPLSDYEADAPVSLGDGTTDVLARLVYQFQRNRFYASGQVGYDLRGDDAPDGYPFYVEAGYTAGPLTISGGYAKLVADGGTDIGDPGFTFPSNQEEFDRTGLKLYGRVTPTFGLVGTWFTTLDGRNTGDSSGGSLGAVFRFDFAE